MLVRVLILTLLPLFSFIGQYFYCKKHNLLPQFSKNPVVYWGDFIFIPINFLAYKYISGTPPIQFLVFFLISFVLNLIFHKYWGLINKSKHTDYHRKHLTYHMYFRNSSKLNFAGLVHFAYSTVQTTVLFVLLFYPQVNLAIYLLVFYYSLVLFYNGVKMYDKIVTWDTGLFIVINLLLLLKVFAY